jgi:serine/threonine protein kinase
MLDARSFVHALSRKRRSLAKVEAVDQEVAIVSPLPKWTREPGVQPIPGYRLIEPLGKGGFGEVWKCEAPGGLYKAIKFVPSQDDPNGPGNQERQALQLVKAIRHPFILSLDRVEFVDGVLVIVMELADKSLYGLLGDYQADNQQGIPREELLGYLLEAAEALDWMNFGHGLQHLDIKPHNLFLVSNHVKVADFGLVDRLTDMEKSHPAQRQGGITPLYAAPELLKGTVSRHCDQYSLAIVYQQLLTGTVPFWCQNMYQLMMLHMTGEPNLTALPGEDRAIVARALSKSAEDRYPSCLDFLQALVCGESGVKVDLPRRAAVVKKLISALYPAETPSRALELNPQPTRDEQRPVPGACNTVPTNRESQAKTPLFGSVSTVSRDAVDYKAASVPRRPSSLAFGPAPTCVSLPGYRFLHCTSQTPLGDVWKAEDEQGRPCRALCLHDFVEQDPALLERLQSLTHPALPVAEVVWSPSGRLVLVTEDFEQTLRDRLEICQNEGLQGIPRGELLGYMRTVAETLDTLYERHALPHLGLNPRALMLREDSVWMLDYGLVPLIWLPTGQTGGSFNGRYAAPELFDKPNLTGIPPGEAARAALLGRAGSTADQYSLALIYAEMLNGIAPQGPRAAPSAHRHSGGPRRSRHDSGSIPRRGQPRVDFDLLPACDRALLLKALNDDPRQRFPSCVALVEALETVVAATACRANLYHRLPAVIPFSSLLGEPPPKDVDLPQTAQLVLSLAMPNFVATSPPRTIVGPQNTRYVLQENDVWECKCPVQIFRGALPLKVEGFRIEWRARVVEQDTESCVFHIDVQPQRRPSDRDHPAVARIAFEVDAKSTPNSLKYFAEARMRVYPISGDRDRLARLLAEMAPRLFDSMRRYLQAGPEQRSEDRWQCPQALHVYPVMPDLELDEILDGMSRNISLGGVSFRVAKAPRAEQAYLHWHKSPSVSPYAVLARIIRVQTMVGGGYEVGAVFPS